jgi:hypothetical protein
MALKDGDMLSFVTFEVIVVERSPKRWEWRV